MNLILTSRQTNVAATNIIFWLFETNLYLTKVIISYVQNTTETSIPPVKYQIAWWDPSPGNDDGRWTSRQNACWDTKQAEQDDFGTFGLYLARCGLNWSSIWTMTDDVSQVQTRTVVEKGPVLLMEPSLSLTACCVNVIHVNELYCVSEAIWRTRMRIVLGGFSFRPKCFC